MKFVILVALSAVAAAAPETGYPAPDPSPSYAVPSSRGTDDEVGVVPILRDERAHGGDGTYSYDVETGDGVHVAESGAPEGPEGAVVASGQFSYTAPDGSLIKITYVANEEGFQPEGDHLPVAPEFPHEIPEFVLRQIEKAAEEDALAAAETRDAAPSQLYQRPQ